MHIYNSAILLHIDANWLPWGVGSTFPLNIPFPPFFLSHSRLWIPFFESRKNESRLTKNLNTAPSSLNLSASHPLEFKIWRITIYEIETTSLTIGTNITIQKPFWNFEAPSDDPEKHRSYRKVILVNCDAEFKYWQTGFSNMRDKKRDSSAGFISSGFNKKQERDFLKSRNGIFNGIVSWDGFLKTNSNC